MIWTLLWVAWFAMFAVIETVAIIKDHRETVGDTDRNGVHDDGFTLSEHLRRWFSVKTKLGRSVFLVAFAGFACWFTLHIALGAA